MSRVATGSQSKASREISSNMNSAFVFWLFMVVRLTILFRLIQFIHLARNDGKVIFSNIIIAFDPMPLLYIPRTPYGVFAPHWKVLNISDVWVQTTSNSGIMGHLSVTNAFSQRVSSVNDGSWVFGVWETWWHFGGPSEKGGGGYKCLHVFSKRGRRTDRK